MRSALALTLGAVVTLTASAAVARQPYWTKPLPMREAGLMSCAIDPSFGMLFGSTRRVSCTFRSAGRRQVVEHYVGHMDRAGFDIGVASGQTITWAVWTPGGRARYGMLIGAFTGTSSEATVVVGPGTQALFDDRGERIALQPVEQSGQVGLNLAFGATALDLRSARYGTLPARTAAPGAYSHSYAYWHPVYGYAR